MRCLSGIHIVAGLILIVTVSPCLSAEEPPSEQSSKYLDAVREAISVYTVDAAECSPVARQPLEARSGSWRGIVYNSCRWRRNLCVMICDQSRKQSMLIILLGVGAIDKRLIVSGIDNRTSIINSKITIGSQKNSEYMVVQ